MPDQIEPTAAIVKFLGSNPEATSSEIQAALSTMPLTKPVTSLALLSYLTRLNQQGFITSVVRKDRTRRYSLVQPVVQ